MERPPGARYSRGVLLRGRRIFARGRLGLALEQPAPEARLDLDARDLRLERLVAVRLHLREELIDLAGVEVDGVAAAAAIDGDALVDLLDEVLAALRAAQLVRAQLAARGVQLAARAGERSLEILDARPVRRALDGALERLGAQPLELARLRLGLLRLAVAIGARGLQLAAQLSDLGARGGDLGARGGELGARGGELGVPRRGFGFRRRLG